MSVEKVFNLSGGKSNTMTKIPLNIDTTPLARAVERSKRKTMTKIIMTNIAEALAVVLILLLGAAILSL
jgi:preprotein translocase subunit SecF